MNMQQQIAAMLARRTFLSQAATGIGSAALSSLLSSSMARAADSSSDVLVPGLLGKLHHAPRAKRIIFLTMAGGPSHLETLDYKPKLAEMNGKPMPESFTKGQPIAQLQGQQLKCLGPQHTFQRFGKSGQQMSSLFTKLGELADELCIVNSLRTQAINHDPAHTFMNTGSTISGRPAMGSWLTYGLGAETENLPGFVVLTSTGKYGQGQPIASRQWHSGFLPSKHQGVELRSKGDPVLYVNRPAGVTLDQQSDVVDAVRTLNEQANQTLQDPEIATRIAQYELAFRMQTSVPQLMDLSDEPQHVLDLYGTKGADGTFAANCLLARRLAERGVRFIQLYHRDWDHHGGVKDQIAGTVGEIDGPCAALIRDLKARDMLKDTLIVWTGEFGRTPMAQGNGRDHHIKGFSAWLCGGGIKGGITYGATDDLGYNAEKDICEVHDLHATLLHLLGVDHERLTFRSQGRDFRLTDVHGHIVKPILS